MWTIYVINAFWSKGPDTLGDRSQGQVAAISLFVCTAWATCRWVKTPTQYTRGDFSQRPVFHDDTWYLLLTLSQEKETLGSTDDDA